MIASGSARSSRGVITAFPVPVSVFESEEAEPFGRAGTLADDDQSRRRT